MAASNTRQGELISGINVTPLVDVVLVLLIVLMVAASYTVSKALPVELPRAETGEATPSKPLTITLQADGALSVEGTALSRPALRERIQRYRESDGKSAIIAADGATPHRLVIALIDVLRSEGVSQFSINVAPGELAP